MISYSYKLTNTGNVTLVAPFTVSDDKVDGDVPGDADVVGADRVDHLHGELHDQAVRHGRGLDHEPCDGSRCLRRERGQLEPGHADGDHDAVAVVASGQDGDAEDVQRCR